MKNKFVHALVPFSQSLLCSKVQCLTRSLCSDEILLLPVRVRTFLETNCNSRDKQRSLSRPAPHRHRRHRWLRLAGRDLPPDRDIEGLIGKDHARDIDPHEAPDVGGTALVPERLASSEPCLPAEMNQVVVQKRNKSTITQLVILRTSDERNRTRRQFIAQAARLWFPSGLCVP
jgi:hypothetical protein